MTQTVGDDGGGIAPIGSAGSVCAISPSDLVGTVDNIITRIEKIEEVLMQIATGNIWANQLSDLSQQVGWVTGVTYMGIPGWTQTEYGTLIPPPGFTLLGNGITLSDGNTYSAVVMDENGVLQFGFTPIGGVEGALPDQWNAASGTQDFSLYAFGGALSPNPINQSRGITTVSNTYSSSVANGSIKWGVSKAGLYLVSASAGWRHGTFTGSIALQASTTVFAGATLAGNDKCEEFFRDAPQWNVGLDERADTNSTFFLRLAIGDTVAVGMSAGNTAAGTITGTPLQFTRVRVGLVRVSSE